MSLSETATQSPQPANVLLEVNDLRVTFATPDGDVTAVQRSELYASRWRNVRHCWRVWIGEIANGVRINGTAGDEWSNRRFRDL
ncbi:oligopeptide transport ATP-binding protein OppD [Salmonella enterica subsp. enterica]|uniref:Oligopeptide transport ATP-binding protein OppD n=1 Tax=Salmonella enterica I TaxID=59201 RepID=A0A447PK69_SALET|nr:oligopeptide transport ATP-binding protein OppD [Salmonella enterica subsp. enterica]